MLECAKSILNKFNLHYQICQLAAEDCSFASARTFDIEIWLPGQNQYREISSISNCTDFQSRRCKTKFKDKNQKSHLVHTLNGSCFAIPRLLVALFETHQTELGAIDFASIETLLSQIEATL
jgi:seryl-tRNA synthetase